MLRHLSIMLLSTLTFATANDLKSAVDSGSAGAVTSAVITAAANNETVAAVAPVVEALAPIAGNAVDALVAKAGAGDEVKVGLAVTSDVVNAVVTGETDHVVKAASDAAANAILANVTDPNVKVIVDVAKPVVEKAVEKASEGLIAHWKASMAAHGGFWGWMKHIFTCGCCKRDAEQK